MSARSLLRRIRRRGGRIYRMREVAVFVLTDDERLVDWLLSLGAVPFTPAGSESKAGSYIRAGTKMEWDLYIHRIPVLDEESIWEAAGRVGETLENAEEAA